MNLIGSKNLETERLYLKPSSIEEQKRLYEILMIPEVNKWYLTSAKNYQHDASHWTWENQKKFYQSKVDHAFDKDVFCWSVFLKDNIVIGQVSVDKNFDNTFNIGWFIDPNYQKQGYAYEAAHKMIEYLFNEVKIEAIRSGAVKENIASCSLFRKLGFKKINEVTCESPYTFCDGLLTFERFILENK